MLRSAKSGGRIRWLVIGPFLVVVALLAGLAVASVDLLSAMRAYVGAESLWSKSQRDAVYHLGRYTTSRDALDYFRFQNALAVPLGDRRARLALDQEPPDLEAAYRGFLEGGNHPDDVDRMILLFQRFRHVSFMADAIAVWAAGDQELTELNELARQAHERIAAGENNPTQLHLLQAQLPEFNARLTELEERFSSTLSEASRTVRRLVLTGVLLLAAALIAGGFCFTAYVLREQSQAERALRESSDRWELAAGAAGIGVFDWDLRTGRATLDARAATLYGLPPVAVEVEAGSIARDAVHPEDAARFRAAMSQSILHPAPVVIRYRLALAGTQVRHIEAIAGSRNDEGGVGVRMVGILRDVSDELRAAQLKLDKEAAERAYRAQSEFLSRVSHELRTPLNAVLGFTELMQTDTQDKLTPAQFQKVGHVLDAGRHLLALINDILELGSLGESPGELPVQPVGLATVLQASLHQVEPMAKTRQIKMVVELPAQALCAMADARRLEQVFVNLLANAIKYNRAEGQVNVSCERVGDELRVIVQDTGPGLRPDQLAQLFQPFNRLGAEFTKVQGSGLGLVITQQLLARMGGQLVLSSTEGVGTRAEVRLRAAPQAANQAASGAR